jgi:hypothetical protein
MAAMLAKAMSTAQLRIIILGIAPTLIAGQYEFGRVFSCTSLKSTAVTLPANCMFVALPIDGLGPVSDAKEFYAQAQESSSVERLRLINVLTGQSAYSGGKGSVDGAGPPDVRPIAPCVKNIF